MKKDKCSPKEEFFAQMVVYYGEPVTAAHVVGYNKRHAMRLLGEPRVQAEISHLLSQQKPEKSRAVKGLWRLAFGGTDSARLLLTAEDVSPEALEQIDLFNVSRIRRGKESVEVNFYNRLEAIQLLLEQEDVEQTRQGPTLAQALQQSAQAVGAMEFE